MEVHHHPSLEKKNFKEYFLEFLMIFLAVTMGFLAENLRENVSNSEKELNYMKGIVQDLKEDTIELKTTLFKQRFLLNEMNAATNIPVENMNMLDAQDTFYRHFIYFYSLVASFTPHDNTLTQLRNAGGFGVIRQKDILDSIGELNLYFQNLVKSDEEYYNTYYLRVTDAGAKVIRCPPFIVSLGDSITIPKSRKIVISNDVQQIQELYSYINMEKGQLMQYVDREMQYHDKIIRLIDYINKKYNLE